MGIKQTGVALAGTVTALVAPPLALAFGWQGALAAIAVATAGAGLAGFLVYRDRAAEPSASGGPRPRLGALLANRDLMLLCAATLLLAGVQLSLVNFLVLFLRDALGYSVAAAAPLLALAQLSGVVGRVGWGVVSDRWFGGERRPVIRLIAALAALGALGLSAVDAAVPGLVLAALVVLAGGSAIGWNGVNMTFVAELAGRRQSASAAGLNLTSSGLGILFGPPLFGALVDATGSYPLGFQCLAGAALAALLLVQLIRPRPPA
jgi:nitrate/nitrite transporter NarK